MKNAERLTADVFRRARLKSKKEGFTCDVSRVNPCTLELGHNTALVKINGKVFSIHDAATPRLNCNGEKYLARFSVSRCILLKVDGCIFRDSVDETDVRYFIILKEDLPKSLHSSGGKHQRGMLKIPRTRPIDPGVWKYKDAWHLILVEAERKRKPPE